jgi:predicted MFS family arabinose efflux permease
MPADAVSCPDIAATHTLHEVALNSTVIESADMRVVSIAERWYVVIVMCLVYAVNIADRYVVSTVLEPIRLDLKLSDAGVGFLTGVPLGLFYVAFGIPMSWLADRRNRRNILVASLIVWSGFTAVCGISRNYWQFLTARIGVGIGETGGTPPANSIIADHFPADRRPMALGVFALGAPIGAWLGANVAGQIANAYGWRAAFLALGIPGVLMGVLIFATIREPNRGRMDAVANAVTDAGAPPLLDSLRFLWRQKAAFHVVMASGVCALWGWGLIWFTPAFLMRSYHLNVGDAGRVTGDIHLVGGILATALTAWILSRPPMADPRRVVWLLALGVGFATIPSFIAYWTHSIGVAKCMFWLFIPAIYFYIGPCMGLMQNLAPPRMRAMFTAWSLVVGNVFNLIIAPQGVGLLSDWFAGSRGADADSLRVALLVLAPTGFWAVYHFCMAARTIVADQARATGDHAASISA